MMDTFSMIRSFNNQNLTGKSRHRLSNRKKKFFAIIDERAVDKDFSTLKSCIAYPEPEFSLSPSSPIMIWS